MAVYFISDLHLGANYTADYLNEQRSVVACLDKMAKDATHIYLLGDVLDYWYEYRHVVLRGHTRFLGKLAELADQGIQITWLTGNHDIWIFDYLPEELGIRVVDGPVTEHIGGITVYMAHGDRQGCDSRSFRFLQKLFRSRLCQKLFAAIHPRWTVPFALRWSGASRKSGELTANDDTLSPAVEALATYSREYLAGHPDIDLFVYGHLHRRVELPLSSGSAMVILPDWMHTRSYARLEDGNLQFV